MKKILLAALLGATAMPASSATMIAEIVLQVDLTRTSQTDPYNPVITQHLGLTNITFKFFDDHTATGGHCYPATCVWSTSGGKTLWLSYPIGISGFSASITLDRNIYASLGNLGNLAFVSGTYGHTTANRYAAYPYVNTEGPVLGMTVLSPASYPEAPEPATWALMIGGLGLVGAAMRRRPTVRVAFAG